MKTLFALFSVLLSMIFIPVLTPVALGENKPEVIRQDTGGAGVISGSTPVAVVNGETLTAADLEHNQVGSLLQARNQYYQQQRKALEQLIDDELLALDARRQQITVQELLEKKIYADVKEPNEDQLEVYYEGTDSKEPFAAVRNQILEHIRQLRRERARTAYVKSLRSQANIRILLAPPAVNVEVRNAYIRGSKDAPVVLVEFADYECPYCQRVHPDLQKLQKEYGSKLAFIFADMPLPMHKYAQKAAEAARCAGEQGKYWEYHDALFASHKLDVAALKERANSLALDRANFDRCLDSGAETAAVKQDADEAFRLGLTGTPSFFINGHFLSGAMEYSALKEMVEQQLASSSANRQNIASAK